MRIPADNHAVRAVKQALTTYGPVVVSIDASDDWSSYKYDHQFFDLTIISGELGNDSFFFCRSGIFNGRCSSDGKTVNHAVTIVGYGSRKGIGYWIVRNQWGTNWGEDGYILMKRGVNQCNLGSFAMYPIIKT